jgi:hypothetical protein
MNKSLNFIEASFRGFRGVEEMNAEITA